MLAILEDVRLGLVSCYEVPQPELREGGILIRTAFSAVSAGTERAHREQVNKSLVGKALARPDQVRQVLDCARTDGIKAAYDRVRSRLSAISPLGYSCAGVVLATGQGVQEFQPGDRVACGGAGYASHCEINFVPKNLAVRVPDSVPLDAASLTTIGAIALQGFRQGQAVLGETVAVIGAGLVGVLTIQIAKAAGCRVIAIDLDPQRVERAKLFGADLALASADRQTAIWVKEFTSYGADVAILTAATPSSEPIELAANIVRDRGRIIAVGDVGLGVSRQPLYIKELSVALSRSYGPGRYDPQYEEGGVDYPIGYVRWTEKRNMQAFLELLASGAIKVGPLIERRCAVERGGAVYEELKNTGSYTVLVEYPAASPAREVLVSDHARVPTAQVPRQGELKVGCIGAGSFARDVIFPALRKAGQVSLHSVATASGVTSEAVRKSFDFARALTPGDLLKDPETHAVFVATRHDTHAQYAIASISHHKPVFVEKPLALNREQLDEIRCAYEAEQKAGRAPLLMVGFNRRFAPFSARVRQFFANRQEPMVVQVRVNAGYIPRDHWVQLSSGGGRIIGEFCHFVDWARSVVGSPIVGVTAKALPDGARYNRDNIVAILSFRDGSIANLLYLANGDKSIAKEHYEVFCEGSVACIRDFLTLELTRGGKTQRAKAGRDKGHNREIERTVEAMRGMVPSPIPFEELLEVSEATIAIAEAIGTGSSIPLPATQPALLVCEPTPSKGDGS